MSIPISVVVCTHNRVDSLRRCVKALASVKTDHEWELVIVDNASDDGTSVFLASLPTQFSAATVVTAFEPKRGLAAARNKGVSVARGNIIAFTDDDCYVSEDYIDAMISAFTANPEIGFVGGRILLYDQSDLRITIQESKDYLLLLERTFAAAGTVQGANMAFRRETIDHIGGFDEDFGAGTRFACEDIDAVASALWAGIIGAYDPRPTVYHHHGRKTEVEERDLRRIYDKARGAYYAKYILRGDSRLQYVRNWMRTIKNELRWAMGAIRRGRRPLMGQSLREACGAIEYIAVRFSNKT